MQEDLVTQLSESSFVEEGFGMWRLHELLEGDAAEGQELVGSVTLFLKDAAVNRGVILLCFTTDRCSSF